MKEAVFSKRQNYWSSIIAEQRSSGLSQTKFCEDRKISKSSFSYWSSGLKKRKSQSSFAAVELPQKKQSAPLKIEFPNGVCIHLVEAPAAEWLVEIMRLIS